MVLQICHRYQKTLLPLVVLVMLTATSLTTNANAFIVSSKVSQASVLKARKSDEDAGTFFESNLLMNRRFVTSAIVSATLTGNVLLPQPVVAKCTGKSRHAV